MQELLWKQISIGPESAVTIDNNTISMTVKQHKDVKTPFISVVVPTRNRAELLTQSALPTVLQQTFEDFELVICDNASSDDTEERVMALKDNRIKFFRSEEWIPKEDFFQWSLERASGEYSMLFFDDSDFFAAFR